MRLAIKEVAGSSWSSLEGAPTATWLANRKANEAPKRPSVKVGGDLLDYADTSHLVAMILKNYSQFEVAFPDFEVTQGLLKSMPLS